MSPKMQVLKPSPRKKDPTRKRKPKYTARKADRYELYQLAVQSPETDVDFLKKTYRKIRGRVPRHLREDFCGTALLACHWIRLGPDYTAEGFDLDPEPLDWGREHNVAPLDDAARRLTLHLADARSPGDRAPDVRCAQNFSYFFFKERATLLEYFRLARKSLAPGGIFVLDLFGGDEATVVMEEKRKIEEGFTYVWDQARYFPGTGEYHCNIHFHFKDGSKLKNAFTYDWRYWSMPELRDVLADAGFSQVHAWFEEGDEDDDEGSGEFKLDEKGEIARECAGWIGYLVAYD
jgi:SAM-dependent methyltransferase